MKRLQLLPVLLVMMVNVSKSQNFDLKVNAGANATQINTFQNRLYVVDAFSPKGAYDVSGSQGTPQMIETTSPTNYQAGFFVDAELGKELWNDWKLSLSLGLNQVAFTYDNHLPANNVIGVDTSMKSVIGNYGNTRLLYLNSRVANISKTFSRLSLQAGPVVSYLVKKQYNNSYLFYNGTDKTIPSGGIFEEKGDARKFLIGGHLNIRYKLLGPVEVLIGSQYFFNSVYEKENTFEPVYKKTKPLQLMVGFSYRVAYF